MICCIDTNIFIHGIKQNSGQQELIDRASYLFNWIDQNKHQVLIPSIVIAEVLSAEPLEKYPVYLDIINKGFQIANFDSRAASQYGIMFMNRIDELKKIADENGIDKQKMKTDHLIIASAVAYGADRIYSHDPGLKIFGQKYIDVYDLPKIPDQQQFLFN